MTCRVGLTEWRLAPSGAAAIRLAAAVGADGIQLDFGGPGRGVLVDGPGRAGQLRAVADEAGVDLLALAGNLLNDIGLTSQPAVVQPVLARLADTATELGVPLLIVPSFRRSAITDAMSFTRTAAALRWAVSLAEARGIVLASENVLPPARARQLVEEVGSPAFRLLLDTFNPVRYGLDPAWLATELRPWWADQIHLKDGPPDTGPSPLLGAGQGGVRRTLTALRGSPAPVRALVLENDYRDGHGARLRADLEWARRAAVNARESEKGKLT
ncbi:2-epi-5-epi-valiolone-7-phosphate 2-epimerase [Actinoplanes sp. SE50]|uniref:2-epi-5-epi-valiolone 7-phosphate 2-epimerase n=1 Tax=Actinoplanes sp. (strain ATCC 31044 / CBS 674.73 / SE50/110) TaxID=134676 RepID=ACBO_ACTS5|nr:MULTISPECIES: TIM barrel protein [unclassified Actinoplanes]Q8RMD1.2 RecName: Full=2-epi-5-epi-valiolone 7-phosphate 2-epimerase [Actinoplanes sp. SE50/110]AEV84574.1 2-epi-5-epi-valiolone-7-phosphate 2-epimerase [Actinoplanes sp. SE50/110]ATO82966.1 2-epi-5-epi-valiolone-7-phosphate 2-epimerase [Actinoplanes sp. SE50]CAD29485.2 2-epi-5-epi-valiolone-7-phosphate 2-epimerase AcbO [Actinoplanes sp. SE50/110]SLM00374.1 2-epi-5-epi-valiolone-7-phosphate 2-epimerase [Actinoplanes sp. SE50/110]